MTGHASACADKAIPEGSRCAWPHFIVSRTSGLGTSQSVKQMRGLEELIPNQEDSKHLVAGAGLQRASGFRREMLDQGLACRPTHVRIIPNIEHLPSMHLPIESSLRYAGARDEPIYRPIQAV